MTTPFSVLLPVYHGDDPEHLRRSFTSVTAGQTLAPAEVVVVRDGPVSPHLDATLAALPVGSPVPVTLVELPENVGLARALTAGLAACRYEIVARQDADDVSRPERFATQVPLLVGREDEPGLDIVGSAIEEFESDDQLDVALAGGTVGMVRTPPLSAAQIERAARFRSPFNHPSVVYRRAAVADAGGYEELDLMEDYWLFGRMLRGGARAANVRQPLVLYRVGAGAYARRGGLRLLTSELRIQRRLHSIGFTTTRQMVRNMVLRGGYRLVPEGLRRLAYRADARRRQSAP
jgi:glycosyltransferase involved in cell wall biosynthesis